jgi:hypothetical protein
MRAGFARFLQWVFGLVFGLSGFGAILAALFTGHWDGVFGGLVLLVFGSIVVGALEFQLRQRKKKGMQLRQAIDRISASVFDRPGVMREGYDLTVTGNPWGAFESDQGAAFTTDGEVGGVRVSVATHASTLGRQFGETSHVYSHVCVDMLGLVTPFSLTKEGAAAKLAHATGLAKEARIGDETFDAAWNIETDADLAKDVLDDSIRARLMDLRSKVGWVSQDFGAGSMSLMITNHGLALRWPGEIDPALATFIRDLLLDMRKNILAHVDRKAAHAGAQGGGYRVAGDGPHVRVEDTADDEAPEASDRLSSTSRHG